MPPSSVIIRIAKGGRVAIPLWMREIYGLKPGRRVLGIANREGWLLLRAVPGRARLRPAHAGRSTHERPSREAAVTEPGRSRNA
jgi:bifunctional DNA-binding transcriptional regulator/antitoxin component of YhaV-PrlF toxin-antitoxin module